MVKVSTYSVENTPYVLGEKPCILIDHWSLHSSRHRVFYIANPVLQRGRNKSGGGYEDLVETNKSMQRATPHDMVGDTLLSYSTPAVTIADVL